MNNFVINESMRVAMTTSLWNAIDRANLLAILQPVLSDNTLANSVAMFADSDLSSQIPELITARVAAAVLAASTGNTSVPNSLQTPDTNTITPLNLDFLNVPKEGPLPRINPNVNTPVPPNLPPIIVQSENTSEDSANEAAINALIGI